MSFFETPTALEPAALLDSKDGPDDSPFSRDFCPASTTGGSVGERSAIATACLEPERCSTFR